MTSWQSQAACRGANFPDDFFTRDASLAAWLVRQFCERCPVRQQCLEDALEAESATYRFGVWGGTLPRQRQRIHEQRRRRVKV